MTPRPHGPLPGPTGAELRWYPVSRRTPLETFLTNAVSSRVAVAREIRRRRPDIIVLSSYDVAFGHFALPHAREIPTAYIYNSSFYSDAVDRLRGASPASRAAHDALHAFMRWVERRTYASATTLIGVSPYSRTEIQRRLGRDVDVAVIPTGTDIDLFHPAPRGDARLAWDLPADRTVLLTVGRLARVKRYDRAIAAARLLRDHGLPCLLVIAGTGPEEAALRAAAAPLGDAVRFVGFVDGEDLARLYRAADVVLCTSEFENWSVSILEALASGTPVVGTPRGSIPDLLGLVDRRLVASDVTPEAIADATAALLLDPAVRDALATRSRATVEGRFSWERTAAALADRFRSAIDTGL